MSLALFSMQFCLAKLVYGHSHGYSTHCTLLPVHSNGQWPTDAIYTLLAVLLLCRFQGLGADEMQIYGLIEVSGNKGGRQGAVFSFTLKSCALHSMCCCARGWTSALADGLLAEELRHFGTFTVW